MTHDQFRLMRDVLMVSFAQLVGPAPEMLTEMVRDGLIEWNWNGGVPVYQITNAGREAVARYSSCPKTEKP